MDDLVVLEASMATNWKWPSSIFSRPKIRPLNHSKYLFEGFCLKFNDFRAKLGGEKVDDGHFRLVATFASNRAKSSIFCQNPATLSQSRQFKSIPLIILNGLLSSSQNLTIAESKADPLPSISGHLVGEMTEAYISYTVTCDPHL